MSDKEQTEKEAPAEKEVKSKEATKEKEDKNEEATKEKEDKNEEATKEKEDKNEEATKKKEVESGKTPPKVSKEQNIIYVGTKPPMSYVMAVITAFNMSGTDRVVLKARGRAISTAVDVAEITRNRFFKDAKVHSIAIGTEEVASREGGNPRNVSIMEITIKK